MSTLPPPPPVAGPPPPPAGWTTQATSCWPVVPTFAGFWSRFLAYVINGLLVLAVAAVPGIIGGVVLAAGYDDTTDELSDGAAVGGGLLLALAGLAALAMFLWLGWREGTTGQSPGKKALGIKVVDPRTGGPIGGGKGIGRKIFAELVSRQVICLGYLWMLWDDKKQTWHDKVVDSIVVEA